MSVDDVLRATMVATVAQFVPAQEWFEVPEEGAVWVTGYRVHRVPLDGTLAERPMILEFGGVRAVFVEAELPFPTMPMRLNPREDGSIQGVTGRISWETTEKGVVLLLLITPFPVEDRGGEGSLEEQAWERLHFARAVIVAALGRNAAYDQLFGVMVRLGDGGVSWRGLSLHPLTFPAPPMDVSEMRLVLAISRSVEFLEPETQRCVRLALRWYQRALGDQRRLTAGYSDVDTLIDYWIALETLTRSGEQRVAGAIIKRLAEIHGTGTQQAGQLFPISTVYKLRKRIMHRGELVGVDGRLMDLLADIFYDILLHTLGIEAVPRTRQYLDGSAVGLAGGLARNGALLMPPGTKTRTASRYGS